MTGPVGSSGAKYEIKMNGNDAALKDGKEEKSITQALDVGEVKLAKVSGTATYTGNASVKGQYTDKLIYTFKEVNATMK
ncbi:hypothetical protein [Eubacterium aggregans]|uniref:hypothetical protein n=1 Tax=Eubacterium aggregans TaxID=81409 RepID=UPI003F37BE6B